MFGCHQRDRGITSIGIPKIFILKLLNYRQTLVRPIDKHGDTGSDPLFFL